MSFTAVIAIVVIVSLSVAALFVAEEPLDEVFNLNSTMEGFPVQTLPANVAQRGECGRSSASECPLAACGVVSETLLTNPVDNSRQATHSI